MKDMVQKAFSLTLIFTVVFIYLFPVPAQSVVNLLSPSNYELDNFDINSEIFVDRSYYIQSQPAGFDEFRAIRTANNDKNSSASALITFSITSPATIYVAYDSRASSLPDWMDGSYTSTGSIVDTSDVNFNLYSKEYPAGEVILGGNKNGGETGAGSNYFVYIEEHADIPLAVTPSLINVEPGASSNAIVSGGTGPYFVASSDSSKATVSISGGIVTITGVSNGSAVITITDSDSPVNTTTINVSVSILLAISENCFHLPVDGIGTVTISGGTSPYTATSNDVSIATVSVDGAEATIVAHGNGNAIITVSDTAGALNAIAVSVDTLSASSDSISLDPGASETITISGGTAPYLAISSVPTVAGVTVSGSDITIDAPAENAGGTISISVQDTPACGNPITKTIIVTVGQTPPGIMSSCPVPPFIQGSVVDPNILLILDHSGSMGSGPGSQWDTAKQVFINIINDFPNVRFGLMRMDGSDYSGNDKIGVESIIRQGGKLLKPCGTPHDEITSYISNWGDASNNPQTWTNLAETLATAGQYFATRAEEGTRISKIDPLDSDPSNLPILFGPYEKNYSYDNYAGASGQTAPGDYDATITDDKGNTIDTLSPIQYYCQQSFIIFVTDGESNYDNDWNVVIDTIGDYDGDGEAGDCENGAAGCSVSGGRATYLDDVAQFLYEHDMIDDLDDMQNLITYVVGFHTDFPLLEQTAIQGGGEYYTAGSEDELTTALKLAINDIFDKISSGTAVSTISTSSTSDDYFLRAKFLPLSWKGFMEAYTLPYTEGQDSVWEAGALLKNLVDNYGYSSRNIYTYLSSSKQSFTSTNNALVTSLAAEWGETDSVTEDWINYLRGDSTNEGSGSYRDRDAWPLGDIIYSSPKTVGAPKFYYGERDYQQFKLAYRERYPVIYVGANDGMLHAFRAFDDKDSTCCANDTCITAEDQMECAGYEQWAFVPGNLHSDLATLVEGDCHRYYVDLSTYATDIWDETGTDDRDIDGTVEEWEKWKTILIGGNRLGGEGYFCLDVTDPVHDKFSVMWNITPYPGSKSSTVPSVGKIQYYNGAAMVDKWLTIITSGYTEGSDKGRIAAFNFSDGSQEAMWDNSGTAVNFLETQANTGPESAYYTLSSPLALDTDGDGYFDLIYAGDTEGSLWKFYYDYVNRIWKQVELFNTGGQFISARPSAAFDKYGNLRIYFGTGKYLINSDRNNNIQNSFYCIIEKKTDDGETTANHGHFTSTAVIEKGVYDGAGVRTGNAGLVDIKPTTSTAAYDLLHIDQLADIGQYGWFFDLDTPVGPAERITEEPLIFSNVVFFTTFTPNSDACGFGGAARLYAVDYLTGLPAKNNSNMVLRDVAEDTRYLVLGGGLPSKPVFYYDRKNRQPTLLIQTSDTKVHEPPVDIEDKPMSLKSWKHN